MQNSFWTIDKETNGELIEKKSRFIANIYPITCAQDAVDRVSEIKKIHRDAKHHVFAYRLSNGEEKYTDDGEPSGTAGVPILDILRGEQLTDVLVVVTRYFGGILLGTGGLVKCYADVCKIAVEKTSKVEMHFCIEYKVKIDYNDYNSIQYYCKNHNVTILNADFLEKVEVVLLVKEEDSKRFLYDLSEITNRNADFEESCRYYHK